MKSMSQALLWEMSRHWYWLVIGFFAAASLFVAITGDTTGVTGDDPHSRLLDDVPLSHFFLWSHRNARTYPATV
jgi:hypothetical protein